MTYGPYAGQSSVRYRTFITHRIQKIFVVLQKFLHGWDNRENGKGIYLPQIQQEGFGPVPVEEFEIS